MGTAALPLLGYQAEAAPLLHPCYFELIGDEDGIWPLVFGKRQF